MTAINIISVGVNCPELTLPKASWQTDGGEETHSFPSLSLGCRHLHYREPTRRHHCVINPHCSGTSWSVRLEEVHSITVHDEGYNNGNTFCSHYKQVLLLQPKVHCCKQSKHDPHHSKFCLYFPFSFTLKVPF